MVQFPRPHPAPQDRLTGSVLLVCNPDRYAFYIDATLGHTSAGLAHVLDEARRRGLAEFDPGDDEPEILDDGTIRIWLTPKDPYTYNSNPLR